MISELVVSSELGEIVSIFKKKEFSDVSEGKKKEYMLVVKEFLQEKYTVHLLCIPIVDDLYRLLKNMASLDPSDTMENCLTHLKCLEDIKEFFSSRLRTFLSSETNPSPMLINAGEVKQLFVPLSLEDCCSFLDMVSKQISLDSLTGNRAIGILRVFSAGVMQGLFDNIIAVLNKFALCIPLIPVPSDTFPYPSSESSLFMIKSSCEIFFGAIKNLSNKKDIGKDFNYLVVMMQGLNDQFFGRFMIAKYAKDVERKQRIM